ncbi:MAG: hypothetical protein QF437_19385 [Planctomycetota bacterium]|jgi:hypothetical protein|nr:hypothetical protein [Planctomycetota bacterium]|tara:strand:+ start:368 stop:583 length:216 start_codon:yes stop_codon:yes gene_type:complete
MMVNQTRIIVIASSSLIGDWAEDNRIVFTEWNGRDGYIGPVVVNADGSGYRRLNNLPPGGAYIRWIPKVKK